MTAVAHWVPAFCFRPIRCRNPHAIAIEIRRAAAIAFAGSTTLNELKRDPQELVDFLFRDNSFPDGAFLMTGTGIVPADAFTLQSGDQIAIAIDGIGVLRNTVT